MTPGRDDVHGYSGPLKVSYGGYFTNIGKYFLDVAAKYDTKRSVTDDANNLFECDQYSVSSHNLASVKDHCRAHHSPL